MKRKLAGALTEAADQAHAAASVFRHRRFLTVRPPGHRMVDGSGILDSQSSGHDVALHPELKKQDPTTSSPFFIISTIIAFFQFPEAS